MRAAVFEDIHQDEDIMERTRLLPYSVGLLAQMVHPNETLSVAHGGAFAGVVTWGKFITHTRKSKFSDALPCK